MSTQNGIGFVSPVDLYVVDLLHSYRSTLERPLLVFILLWMYAIIAISGLLLHTLRFIQKPTMTHSNVIFPQGSDYVYLQFVDSISVLYLITQGAHRLTYGDGARIGKHNPQRLRTIF